MTNEMKKVINGKLYNTETARFCARYSSDWGGRDFRHYEEHLYLKKTGEFFLAGKGGPESKYSVRDGDGWSSGKKIIPLTRDEARSWAEKHLSADEYIEIFGEPEE